MVGESAEITLVSLYGALQKMWDSFNLPRVTFGLFDADRLALRQFAPKWSGIELKDDVHATEVMTARHSNRGLTECSSRKTTVGLTDKLVRRT